MKICRGRNRRRCCHALCASHPSPQSFCGSCMVFVACSSQNHAGGTMAIAALVLLILKLSKRWKLRQKQWPHKIRNSVARSGRDGARPSTQRQSFPGGPSSVVAGNQPRCRGEPDRKMEDRKMGRPLSPPQALRHLSGPCFSVVGPRSGFRAQGAKTPRTGDNPSALALDGGHRRRSPPSAIEAFLSGSCVRENAVRTALIIRGYFAPAFLLQPPKNLCHL